MPIFDCSVPIKSGLVTWPGDGEPRLTQTKTLAADGAEVSQLLLSTHTGTHIDAPRHFIAGGTGIDALPLENLVGPAVVVDLTELPHNQIQPADLAGVDLSRHTRLLFKTKNSTQKLLDQTEFTPDYVSLSLAAAELLVAKGIKLVGIDYLSIEAKGSPGHPVHVALLDNGVINLEGVRLVDVAAGEYMMAALPLIIVDADGSPARVLLWREA